MPSFASALTVALLLVAAPPAIDVEAQSAEAVYDDVLAREAELRKELDLAPQLRAQPPGSASVALLRRVRATVQSYEAVVSRFPKSAYSDNALWQGAVLAADAFWQFGDGRDRVTALRLFSLLTSRYPTSSLVKQVSGQTDRLNAALAASASSPAAQSTLKAIRREVMPESLRITLELEREAVFHDEKIDGPPRVFIDLQHTRAVDALKDATLSFPDDVVRQIRVGRQLDARTRVVFDLQGAGRYSIYSLYNPYRLVIDFPRPAALAAKAPTAAPVPPSAPALEAPIAPPRDAAIAPPSAPPIAPPSANGRGGFSLSRQLGLGISRVVIDPGHGGRDPGAKVKGLMSEAELVLDVAQRLEKLLLKQPGVDVVLTRGEDVFVPLEERAEIANRAGADLFLSIHANASAEPSARGFETYFLNFATNPEAEAIAARENAASARTMRNLPDIVKAIALNNKIDESRDFASLVQGSMSDRLKRVNKSARSLGVKQAPFMVLIGATMPSVLVEISFLTNKQEAGLLKTANYRQQIAEALLAGVMKYQKSLKAQTAVLSSGF